MNVYDNNGNKHYVDIDKTIFNNKQKIIEFIEKPKFYSDKEILNILKLNYTSYGIICKSLIKNKTELTNDIFYSNINLLNNLNTINVLSPELFLKEINDYINNINILLKNIEKYHKQILEYDNKILIILSSLRNSDYLEYLKHLCDLNNIRLLINRIYFEYYQDLVFHHDKLCQIKYDYFITESNIQELLEKFNKIKKNLNVMLNEELYLHNNNNKIKIKNNNGLINYQEFINIIDKCIENI